MKTNYLKNLLGAGFLLLLAACNTGEDQAGSDTETTDNSGKPNIIYILADDLGYGDLSCYGQDLFSTPNIDKLAASGMLFTQHYSGNTVCAPSRSALMTGQHTGHTFVRGNKEVQPEGQYPIPDNTFTLAEAMKDAGYVTGAYGKWGLGYPGSEGDPVNQGFDTFFGYNCQRMGHHYYPHHLWSNRDSIILEENAGKLKGNYAPDMIHEKVLEFITTNQDKPFFLYVPSIIPHAELIAPDSIMDKYRGKFLPEKVYEGYDDGPKYRQGPYESQAESHAAFAAMIEILDKQVGEIVAKVEELGLTEKTIIMFTSDNGPHQEGGADPEFFDSNGPLRGVKRDLYEGGIRVPFIASWPGKIQAGSRSDHISAFWDLFPTIAQLSGLEEPENIDGVSFLPTLLGEPGQEQHEYLYWEFHERGGRIAARKGKWKGVKYNVLKEPDAPMELYDLSQDIGEDNNIAAEHPEVVAEMEEIFRTARTPSEVFTFNQGTYLQKD
ncbi:arylsulfatase [Flavilitoribacter nigricans]|uniref:Arylsulfatase n=1 Tax=Flavilitoribacter nigricans (strain ATCC 23147 / DSM 23189 / NBRC 102662 / NCIMB 1420 / SS-2) TaxID=1122177 RepID=A0A2D0ND52_FLAN2|nr:arylsulfatase [Flavilitoribacter nigricans]PHN05703.1 arylsulfatase [Flavilitoribacter nigricans DSM 23189 = NBRC 102662]